MDEFDRWDASAGHDLDFSDEAQEDFIDILLATPAARDAMAAGRGVAKGPSDGPTSMRYVLRIHHAHHPESFRPKARM